jgi:hypothetical protein
LVVGIIVLLSYPFTIGPSPGADAGKAEVKAYLTRLTVYFGASAFAMLGAAFCAALIVRRTRIEFAEKKLDIFEKLITEQAEILHKKTDEPD